MKKTKVISASQLGSACVCEQQALFDSQRGLQRTADQKERIDNGVRTHKRLHAAACTAYANVETSSPDRRCFVATHLFGADGVETEFLRCWRDSALMKTLQGRVIVGLYYRWSPIVVRAMDQSEFLKAITKWGIRKLIKRIAKEEHLP